MNGPCPLINLISQPRRTIAISTLPVLINEGGMDLLRPRFNVNSIYNCNCRPDHLWEGLDWTPTGRTPLCIYRVLTCEYHDILTHHSQYDKTSAQRRENPTLETLGFVTPWNNRGYDIVLPQSQLYWLRWNGFESLRIPLDLIRI